MGILFAVDFVFFPMAFPVSISVSNNCLANMCCNRIIPLVRQSAGDNCDNSSGLSDGDGVTLHRQHHFRHLSSILNHETENRHRCLPVADCFRPLHGRTVLCPSRQHSHKK